MSKRNFQLRLRATYQSNENKVDDLVVEVLHDGKWEVLDLGIRSPGFLMYITALFSCQHLYMRTNCAERNLVLASAEGDLKVEASEIWEIEDIKVHFTGRLASGAPNEDALAYITERMHHCPVSTNLPRHIPMQVSVDLV